MRAMGGKIILFLFCFFLLSSPCISSQRPNTAGERIFGSGDFIAYWGAFKVFRQGGDPYDPQSIFAVQHELNKDATEPQIFLNPPWSLILLAPFLSRDFLTSVHLWILCNLAFVVLIVFLTMRLLRLPKKDIVRPLIVAFGFLPVWITIMRGQLSLLLAFIILAAVVAYVEKKDVTAGFFLALATIKPQFAFLIMFALGFSALIAGRWRVLASCFLTLFFAAGTTHLISPGIFVSWVHSSSAGLVFFTSSLVTFARIGMGKITGNAYDSRAAIIVPGIAIVIVARALLRSKATDWRNIFNWVAPLSLLTAPYIWPHDYSLLLPVQIGIMASVNPATHKRRYLLVASVLLAMQGLLLVETVLFNAGEYYFWFPLAMMAVAARSQAASLQVSKFTPVIFKE
jgi:hypothetical protein